MREKFFSISFTCRENGKDVGHHGLMAGPNMRAVVEMFFENHKDKTILEFTIAELLED